MAKMIKQAVITVNVFKYDTPEEQAEHVVKMQAKGWEVSYVGKYYLGESRLDEYINEANWHLVTEFSKILKDEDPEFNYEIQTRLY